MLDLPQMLIGVGTALLGAAAVFNLPGIIKKINRKDAPSDFMNAITQSIIHKYYASEEGIVLNLHIPVQRKKIIDRIIELNNLGDSKGIRRLVEFNVKELMERGY